MKKLWAALGIALGAFCLLGLLIFGVAYSTKNKVGQDARAYVRRTAPTFLASDTGSDFMAVAAPRLQANTSKAGADKMFALIRKKLGRFQGLRKVTLGETTMDRSPVGTEQVVVGLKLQADYDKGPADFDAAVVRENDTWKFAMLKLMTKL